MLDALSNWINDPGFMPHGHCFLWTPHLLWLYVLADGVIVLSYYSIPPALWLFVKRRPDLDRKYKWLVVLFGVFIFACGTTHLIKIWNIWNHAYWLEAWALSVTALVSALCAIGVWPLLPKLIALPSPDQYQAAYGALLQRHTQLDESENRFRVLIETAGEGVWLLDRTGITTFANPALCEMFRCVGGMEGRSLFEFVFAEDQDEAEKRLLLRLAGDRQRREFRWRCADGAPIHTLISTSVLMAPNGSISGIMAVISDISERVAMSEQLQQLNQQLGQRVELRTRELEESNRELAREIVVREYVQTELSASNERLNLYLTALQRHTDDISRLNELGDQLNACDTRPELIQVLQSSCQDLFNTTGGALFEAQGERMQLLEFGWGDCAGLEGAFHRELCRALQEGHAFPGDVAEQSDAACVHRPSLMPALCVPLYSRGVQVGLLLLQRTNPFWSDEAASDRQLQQLLRALAEHTALALDNLTLREKLREQSLSDPLTGLFNRRYLFEQMDREMARWERTHQPFALMLIDIDHFKKFNDRYGHDVGDAVLVEVSNLLREFTRRSDLACRLGGEEFVVLIAGVEQEQAVNRAEAIRVAIKRLLLDGVEETISISSGVAMYPQHGEDPVTLLRAADQALYASKRSGRDRTSLAGAVIIE